MRYVLAIAALVLSGVLLLLGIGQRTFLAGPAEISYELETPTDAGFVTISGEELAKVPGQANIVAGGAQAVVATGSTNDVTAWVEPFEHATLSVDRASQALVAETVSAVSEEPSNDSTEEGATAEDAPTDSVTPMSPRGSDLWLDEMSVDGTSDAPEQALRMPVKISDEQTVIIAADGKKPAPEAISVVWVQDRSTPWAGPLLVAGAVLGVVGAVLYILAFDHDRRGLGPRRGRRGPLQGIRNVFAPKAAKESAAGTEQGTQKETSVKRDRGTAARRFALPTAGLALAVGLSGCSASYWPEIGAEIEEPTTTTQAPSSALVPVTESQIARILADVAEAADAGDESLDAGLLKERFTGDALAQRTANYAIRKAGAEWLTPPHLTKDELDYELVQSTESWPRTMLVTVASTKDSKATDNSDEAVAENEASPSLALILTQENPHSNYLVSSVIALRGGIAMPQAAPAEEGTALLADDLETFMLPPGEVGAAFASVLQNGESSEFYEMFDLEGDTILENSGKQRAERLSAEAAAKEKPMEYSVAVRQADTPVVAMSTGVGGALVSVTVIEEQIVDSAGGLIKPVATAQMTALSGLEGQQDRIVQEFAHQMLFFVPSKSDENAKIQLLGDTSEMVGARN